MGLVMGFALANTMARASTAKYLTPVVPGVTGSAIANLQSWPGSRLSGCKYLRRCQCR